MFLSSEFKSPDLYIALCISSKTLFVENTVCLAPNLSGLQQLAILPIALAVFFILLNISMFPRSNNNLFSTGELELNSILEL